MTDQPIPAADSVERTLAQFSTAFTVRDLMTSHTALVGADSAQAARSQHERHGYDVIAYPSAGPTTGYYYRGGALTHITPADLVSCDTSLLDLLPLLAEREFFFALHGTQISGYVHFSDLNKPLMRMPFYLLLEATERHLLSTLRQTLTQDQAKGALPPSRVKKLQEFLDTAARQRADTNFWDVLGLPDVLGDRPKTRPRPHFRKGSTSAASGCRRYQAAEQHRPHGPSTRRKPSGGRTPYRAADALLPVARSERFDRRCYAECPGESVGQHSVEQHVGELVLDEASPGRHFSSWNSRCHDEQTTDEDQGGCDVGDL